VDTPEHTRSNIMPDRQYTSFCGMGPAVQKTIEIPWEATKGAGQYAVDGTMSGLTSAGESMSVVPGADKVFDTTKGSITFCTENVSKSYTYTVDKTMEVSKPLVDQTETMTAMVVDQTMAGTKVVSEGVTKGYDQAMDASGKALAPVGDGMAMIPGGDKLVEGTKGATTFVTDGTKTATGAVMDSSKASTAFVTDGLKAGMDQGMQGVNTAASSAYDMTGKGLSQVGDGVAMIPGGDKVVEGTKAGLVDPVNKFAVDPMVEMTKTSQASLLDVASNSVSEITSTVTTAGGAVGFQSLMGGLFGANVDKSDAGLEAMFKTMDADGSGKVSEEEMKAAITKVYGEALPEDTLKTMMDSADTNKDGEVDLDEFKTIMRAGPDSK